jgi:hypothetical protein
MLAHILAACIGNAFSWISVRINFLQRAQRIAASGCGAMLHAAAAAKASWRWSDVVR